ncbi:hypothetical protein BDV35DRAFT_399190 [Aspergillus flavus]|uniref:Uncharacterized protein n=1 Tax=Aspergillus flavus TaxID=5059 RepID=A0A5N6GET8_ASPFL|nr:hypothetical protein BDV35DRAFT_399190 [Aspergillus flavus]
MVTPQPKPDSSYASNRLTKQNYRREYLLTFQNNEAPEPVTKPEPATDDEPLSSSKEKTQSNASLDNNIGNKYTLSGNSPNAEKKTKDMDMESQKDDGFKVPKDIDIKSPPSKSHSSPKFKSLLLF